MAFGKVYQFKALCFGLSAAPLVFTCSWRLANSGVLPRAGSSSLRTVLRLFNSLGIVVNWEKSQLVSHQKTFYLGVQLDSVSFQASPAQKQVNKLLSIGSLFLSCVDQHTKSWLELMGMLSSLSRLILGVRLRMRSFQFALHRAWDRLDPETFVRWSSEIRQVFFWWLDRERLELVISLEQVSPQLDLWSDSSDVGWGSAPRRGGSFRPLVSRGAVQLHPSSRSFNNFLCAPVFSFVCSELRSSSVCGQHDSAGLPTESGGRQISGF